jgi:hypothetical protein
MNDGFARGWFARNQSPAQRRREVTVHSIASEQKTPPPRGEFETGQVDRLGAK